MNKNNIVWLFNNIKMQNYDDKNMQDIEFGPFNTLSWLQTIKVYFLWYGTFVFGLQPA